MISIVVCLKQVIDPEAPVSLFKIDAGAKRAMPPAGTPPVLNPFDENALEAALKIKDSQDTRITALSMGWNLAKAVVKKSLAAGADELILLEDEAFQNLDSYATASILAAAINKIGQYDLILCGREASDTNAGQVGSGIAEILGLPSVIIAGKIEVNGRIAKVEHVLADGHEVIEVSLPALVTASNEIGELRYPSIKDIMAAQKKDVSTWSAGDLEVSPSPEKRANLLKLYQPLHEVECEVIKAESPEEEAVGLALRLRKAKVI